jgi:hypothetical protein
MAFQGRDERTSGISKTFYGFLSLTVKDFSITGYCLNEKKCKIKMIMRKFIALEQK